ncbi:MAG: DUF177 domain-containing protein, partial [Oscillospiraceae bacterium]|nr:DUF177 domain-containing protein [Oscillospiraceae bacterium]
MILDFKKIFADEDGTLSFDYNMDLSETKVSTSYPFVSPVRIKGTAVGKDGFVQLGFRVSFDFSIPCDRCARRVDRHYRYSFSHVLVHSLENKE